MKSHTASTAHASGSKTMPAPPDDQQAHHHAIEVAAYQRAEQRGFAPGGEMDDWLGAEASFANRDSAHPGTTMV